MTDPAPPDVSADTSPTFGLPPLVPMLRLAPIVAVLALAACASMEPVGTEAAESFHGANVVYVVPAESGAEAASAELALRGWPVESSNARALTTGWKSDGGRRYRLTVADVGGRLAVRGEFAADGLGGPSPIVRTGQSGSPARRAWEALEDAARALGTVDGYARL